ncbi:MAG: nucleotide exchange factor GrpE, partial [Acholeplasmatales bacterium]|nr:nucleotide exchange factor GrpE [Acholeplasmatales bacterium]
LEAEVQALQKEVASWKNEYLKAHAETENFKKRTNEQAMKDRKYASQKVIGELIQPIDMLVQIVNYPATNPEVANYQIGFQMIANQLVDILKGEGLSSIEAIDKEFDPKIMEAVQTEENLEKEDNIVLKVMQPGYMYKDRVLRPAMVVVNKKNNIEKEEQ